MGLFTTLISGTESAKDLPDKRVILFVDALKDVDTRSVRRIRAIFCREKGMNSHLEVICKIKGIPIIRCDSLDFVQGRHMEFEHERMLDPTCIVAFQDFRGSFQVSVYDIDDLEGLEFGRIDTIFVRLEHVLHRLVLEQPEMIHQIQTVEAAIRDQMVQFVNAVPSPIRILLRGMDVRSSDPVLSPYFFEAVEPNPEMGMHGTRFLLNHAEWVEITARAISGLDRVSYGCPFITKYQEYADFVDRFAVIFGPTAMVPFAETPAIFGDISKYKADSVCLGLKDIAQFYWAADRSQPVSMQAIDYVDSGFMSLVKATADCAIAIGSLISVYQDLEMLPHYVSCLGERGWSPSLGAHDFRLLTRSLNEI